MLQALQRFFASLVHSANTSFDALLDSLLSSAKPSPQSGGLAKQALYSVAQCVAVLCLAAGDQKCASTVEMLKGILKDDSSMNSVSCFWEFFVLYCLFLQYIHPFMVSYRNAKRDSSWLDLVILSTQFQFSTFILSELYTCASCHCNIAATFAALPSHKLLIEIKQLSASVRIIVPWHGGMSIPFWHGTIQYWYDPILVGTG